MSSTAHYVGAAITPVRTRIIRDPQRGLQTVWYYKGTLTQIDAVVALVASDQRWEKEEAGDGMWELSIYTPDAAGEGATPDQQDSWELLNNRVEKDLYEHPRSKAISEENIKILRKFLKSPIADAEPAVTGATGAEATLLYQLLLKGTNKFTSGEYVLRYSITVSSRSSVNASFADVHKLFTPAQLATPATSLITIPSEIGFALADIPTVSAPTGFLWSWLKMGPTVRRASYGKAVISQEWWLDLWSTYIYTPKA
jgi:hypothetical protein